MRVLITGAEGQLGWEFARLLAPRSDCLPLGRNELDVTDADQVMALLRKRRPDLVIHCAAWTDVDGCEREPERANQVNAEGTRAVAQAAAEIGTQLVYISTDFVFDGAKAEPYTEEDAPNPINVYGRTKLAGESHVRQLCPRHYVIRTAWLFGLSPRGFVAKILTAALQRQQLRVAHDQVGSPTHVGDLAGRAIEVVARASFGTYHVTNGGHASRYQWATEIVRLAGLVVTVVPIAASEWHAPARRPANSRLDNRALREAGFSAMRPYQDALAEVVPQILHLTAGR